MNLNCPSDLLVVGLIHYSEQEIVGEQWPLLYHHESLPVLLLVGFPRLPGILPLSVVNAYEGEFHLRLTRNRGVGISATKLARGYAK